MTEVTFALVWDQFSRDEREVILKVLNMIHDRNRPLHMGTLPFVNLQDIYYRLMWVAQQINRPNLDMVAGVSNDQLKALAERIEPSRLGRTP